jgi:hypothetical protein
MEETSLKNNPKQCLDGVQVKHQCWILRSTPILSLSLKRGTIAQGRRVYHYEVLEK